MKQPKLRHLPLAAAALVACSGAMAGYQSPDGNFTLSGFGTLGAAKTSTDDVEFVYPGQRGGATKSVSFNPDSKLAVQGTYKFTPTFSATAQVMTKFDGEGQYEPKAEWVFGKWQASPNIALRVGRIGAPFFMVSDFRDVGYANTPARPNLDVYGQVPFSSFVGADAAYQETLGPATITTSIWSGDAKSKYTSAIRSSGREAAAVDLDLKNAVGFNIIAELDNGLTLRAGHTQGKLSSNSQSASTVIGAAKKADAISNAITPVHVAEVAVAMTTSNSTASFSGIGLSYDQNDIVLSSEYTMRKSKTGYIADTKGWYVLGGYRFGSVLPYMTWSRLTTVDPNVSISASTLQTLGGVALAAKAASNLALAEAAGGAYYGSQAILNTQKQSEHTVSAGVRWDAHSGLAVKAQFDHVNVPKGSHGLFLMADPVKAAQGGDTFLKKRKDINVLSVSVDFVF